MASVPDLITFPNPNKFDLRFTSNVHPNTISFLDFSLVGDPIQHSVHTLLTKDTAENTILHARSNHFKHNIQ